jgi:hypothetical protein
MAGGQIELWAYAINEGRKNIKNIVKNQKTILVEINYSIYNFYNNFYNTYYNDFYINKQKYKLNGLTEKINLDESIFYPNTNCGANFNDYRYYLLIFNTIDDKNNALNKIKNDKNILLKPEYLNWIENYSIKNE